MAGTLLSVRLPRLQVLALLYTCPPSCCCGVGDSCYVVFCADEKATAQDSVLNVTPGKRLQDPSVRT